MSETLNLTPAPTGEQHCWLPNSRRAPGLARRLLRELLDRVEGGQRFLDDGELVLSELVTNALVHGTRADRLIWIGLRVNSSELWIAVEDACTDAPQLACEGLAESGRGLLLVQQLSLSWGFGPRKGIGKRVWSVVAPGRQN
ncbi:anti-sigma regulatory factor (Ser/Thr protein kinase) [Kitasatospora sp. MAP12-15]|uniref:ATP-binding protein n=1 Tax=unclassified Kitasatospora TaxID=2633591 RepID=UPI0024756923|nr:ATP-binding protein [Kitasatospora sp. MAP12-44]MDH6112401.1 anti-sigma regulatory factor (Ser/Thr protein kinase) [Kitasatospora sp. MAP12-44]